jgi:hypothetical protein
MVHVAIGIKAVTESNYSVAELRQAGADWAIGDVTAGFPA